MTGHRDSLLSLAQWLTPRGRFAVLNATRLIRQLNGSQGF